MWKMLMQVKVLRKAKVLLTARMKTKVRVKRMVKAETKAMMKTTVKDGKEKDNHKRRRKMMTMAGRVALHLLLEAFPCHTLAQLQGRLQ